MGSARVVFAGSVLWRFRFCYYFRFRVAFACSLCRVSEGPSAEAAGAAGAPAYIYIGWVRHTAAWRLPGGPRCACPQCAVGRPRRTIACTPAQLDNCTIARSTHTQADIHAGCTSRSGDRPCARARVRVCPWRARVCCGTVCGATVATATRRRGVWGRPRQERGRERGREGRRLRAHSGARQRPRCPLIFSLCSTRRGVWVWRRAAGLHYREGAATGRPALFCVATPTALLEQYCGAPAHWGGVQEWCPRI